MKVTENTPAVLPLGKLCDENGYSYEWINGQKPHLIKKKKTVFEYNVVRRTSFRSWFQACHRVLHLVLILQHPWHLQGRRVIILHILQARLLHQPQLCQATVRLEHGRTVKITCWPERTWRPINQANQKSKTEWTRRPRFRTERPVKFRHTGMGARIHGTSRWWQSSWTQRLTRQFFSWTIFGAYACDKWGFG